ncbi:MAG TPA: hypothetical protein VFF76_07280 [Holophagaceae bacterium]|nr:hypothetical protein [Holophagaceae bacterium]
MKPNELGWVLSRSGIRSFYSNRGKLIGSVWEGLTGWWSSSGIMGGPVKCHPTLARAKAEVVGGAA